MLDKAGPLVTIIVGGAIGVLSVAGIACLRFTFHTYHVDLFPVFLVGVAVGGSLIRFCGYSVGFLFPSHSALLIATASVLFDGSCLVFPLLRAIFSGLDNPVWPTHLFATLFTVRNISIIHRCIWTEVLGQEVKDLHVWVPVVLASRGLFCGVYRLT